jgi:hypothetical protein
MSDDSTTLAPPEPQNAAPVVPLPAWRKPAGVQAKKPDPTNALDAQLITGPPNAILKEVLHRQEQGDAAGALRLMHRVLDSQEASQSVFGIAPPPPPPPPAMRTEIRLALQGDRTLVVTPGDASGTVRLTIAKGSVDPDPAPQELVTSFEVSLAQLGGALSMMSSLEIITMQAGYAAMPPIPCPPPRRF